MNWLVVVSILMTWHVTIVKGRRVYDLSHTLDSEAPQYPIKGLTPNMPDFEYFKSTSLYADYLSGDMWVAMRSLEFFEHMGTHIDAPNHFGRGRSALHEIPPERLMGPGVVIDVRDKVEINSDYAVTVQDILDHEAQYGMIEPHSIVIMNSGWEKYYPDPVKTFGTPDITNFSAFHFPGFSLDACKMLLEQRQVFVVGSDTPSVDPGSMGNNCHMYLQPNDVILIEYAAKLSTIPPRNTTIILGTPKFRNSTGAPTRLLAFVDEDDDIKYASSSSKLASIGVVLNLLSIFQIMF